MTRQISAQELRALSKALQKFVDKLIEVRNDDHSLTPKQSNDLEFFERKVLDLASELGARAVGITLGEIGDDLKVLQNLTVSMNEATKKIADIKHVITLVTEAVTLAGTVTAAIASGNVPAMIAAAGAVLDTISPAPAAAGEGKSEEG